MTVRSALGAQLLIELANTIRAQAKESGHVTNWHRVLRHVRHVTVSR